MRLSRNGHAVRLVGQVILTCPDKMVGLVPTVDTWREEESLRRDEVFVVDCRRLGLPFFKQHGPMQPRLHAQERSLREDEESQVGSEKVRDDVQISLQLTLLFTPSAALQ